MKRFVEGQDRAQSRLFPECLEDWIGEDNPIRAIDVLSRNSIWPMLGLQGLIRRRPPHRVRFLEYTGRVRGSWRSDRHSRI
jgi:hypothetical protein